MDGNYKDEKKPEMSWKLISRRDLLKKGIAFSAIIPLLPLLGTKEAFAAAREKSGKSKAPHKNINVPQYITNDILADCKYPKDIPNGCDQCATTLKSSTISAGYFAKFLKDVFEDGITKDNLADVLFIGLPIHTCGNSVPDEANIVKDENGNIVTSKSSGYCNANVSEFGNIPTLQAQWIVTSYLSCLYGITFHKAYKMAWYIVGKPIYH